MKIAVTIVLGLFLIVPKPIQISFGQTIVESTNYDQYLKCVGVGCKNMLLENGTITATPQNISLIVNMFKQNFPTSSQPQQQQTQDEVEDEDDSGSVGDGAIKCDDPNWNGEGICIDPSVPKCQGDMDEVCYTSDGDLKNLENQPYCDEVSDDYSGGCWDRKDYDQDTGLYPCKGTGSSPVYKQDWRECNGDG
jgi:hypothetical protein